MRRGAKPGKAKGETRQPVARTSPKKDAARGDELEKRLAEALEQQKATSEILRVISSSPSDARPVFERIVASAGRLCGAESAVVYRFEGGAAHFAAHYNLGPEAVEAYGRRFPRPLHQTDYLWRIANGSVLNSTDIEQDSRMSTPVRADYRSRGARSAVWVPMVREGQALGAISVTHRDIDAFSPERVQLLKTFADQAVIAIENVRLFKELEARNRDLTESLERETATGEILRVISASPTDIQPVLVAILDSGRRLCDAEFGAIFRFENGVFVNAASTTGTSEFGAWIQRTPIQPGPGTPLRRIGVERRPVQVADILSDPDSAPPDIYRREGMRTALAVPMLKDSALLGALTFHRRIVKPFTDQQVALLQTFAAQAVIAIENVRLFKALEGRNSELRVALEQQTATGEILRVISRATFDLQPVFDTIAENAVRLCEAERAFIFRFDGELLRAVASYNVGREVREFVDRNPVAPGRQSISARAALERRTVHIPDVQADPDYAYAVRDVDPIRTILAVPILKGGDLVGTITIYRLEVKPFTDKQIALVETFADQAVIAIENVRLFDELEERNRDLTATSEILRVISSSPTDVQPVFDTIVKSAVALCGGLFSTLFQFDGDMLHILATHNPTPEALEVLHSAYPSRPTRALVAGRAILDRAVVHIHDIELDPESQQRAIARAVGWRSALIVPMLREGAPMGVITVGRAEIGPFSDSQIALLKTFADQAVIAVENVRLFKELQTRTGELTQSVEKLTALGEVSHALSSTLDVETVLSTIVSRASQLAGAAGCSIYEYDEAAKQFELRATHNDDAEFVEALRAAPLRKGEGLMGRAAEMREPIQISDITQPGSYQSSLRDTLIRFGYRALLAVPLLREDQIIGSLSFNRKVPGEFPPEVIDVLKTFATQSALAIQNARLFREIADKSAQLEAASRHKSEFLANMSHELRTPLNAIIGFSEVLVDRMFGELNEKQEEYLKDIYSSGQHLLSLINDILDLSKIEAGRMELEAADFDLPSAIDNALTLVRERAGRRGITLGHSVDERLGPIRGDERKVKQVLLNLLSNALKFTPEGGRIDVRARVHDEVAEVSVADTGVGIAPEDQEAVFEEFRQVGTADKKVEGTGLGLALSRKFIELHGGRIWVKSQVGEGSTFTFTLPVRREE